MIAYIIVFLDDVAYIPCAMQNTNFLQASISPFGMLVGQLASCMRNVITHA